MTHLIIIQGHERGREITVPQAGIRVGRAHANDVVIPDEAVSQFHCRFFFKSDQTLWVTDFASTNETLVNDKPVTEARLHNGDRVEVGNEIFHVVRDQLAGENTDMPQLDKPAPPPPVEQTPEPPEPAPPVPSPQPPIDLGFGPKPPEPPPHGIRIKRLLFTAASMLVIVLLAGVALHIAGQETAQPVAERSATPPLHVIYEKVEAGPENIFRYALRIEDGHLHIQIDDIKNRRHVAREKELDEAVLRRFTETLQDTRFTLLQPDYTGVAPGIHNSMDLTVVIGSRAHRVRILNRMEPEDFRHTRELIEEFGRTELGLAALAMTPERLLAMAEEAYLEGRTRFEQREVRHGNLAESVRQFTLALWYLETIEPKPDYFPRVLQGLERSQTELNERYNDLLFRAERSIKLRDWEDAARTLRVMLELIPDRSDERNQTTERRLITVERYLRR